LRSSSRSLRTAALAALALALLTGCAPADDPRPDPTEIVERYLGAIAAGDVATAAELDGIAIDEDESVDTMALRVPAVLEGAQRLTDITVDPVTSTAVVGDGETATAVSFTAMLAGERIESFLPVWWDDEIEEWTLGDTLAEPISVTAQIDRTRMALIGFSVPGAQVPGPLDQETAPLAYLAYPGVYQVTADLDPALLTDPAQGTTRELVVGVGDAQAALVYEVNALP
jgi:hypothetical protein